MLRQTRTSSKNFVIAIGSAVFVLAFATQAMGHARLLSPSPRNNSDAVKIGPCGGYQRGSSPTTWVAGSQVTIKWEETIDHPGRYIVSFSFSGDQGFQQNVLAANIPDVQGTATLPHSYSFSLTVPSQPCEACTLQLIQSMEENPAAPTYYYSCADIRIVASTNGGATPTPTPKPPPSSGEEGSLSSADGSNEFKKPGMGGCGFVSNSNGDGGAGRGMVVSLLLLLPLWCAALLKIFFQNRTGQFGSAGPFPGGFPRSQS